MPGVSSSSTPYDSGHARDSLELASLASSTPDSNRTSLSSSRSGISPSRKLSLDDDDDEGDSLQRSRSVSGRPGHLRNLSSAFDFLATPYPLSPTALEGYRPVGAPSSTSDGGSLERHKTLTYLNGLSLLIGLIVGSGIFSSPSQVNGRVGSPGASLIVWALAGVLAWTGAASYAELGTTIPLNGGTQTYLTRIFHGGAGFLFAWNAVCVIKPGSAAIISIIFGEYLVRAMAGAEAAQINPWANKAVAIGGMLVVVLLNCLSTKLSTRVSNGLLFLKFLGLLAVIVTGVVVAITGYAWKGNANRDWKTTGWFENTSTSPSDWAVALYAGLWAFDGWDNVNYVAGEFVNPHRNLPRVIHTSMPLVTLFYLLANLAYVFVLPFKAIGSTNTVAVLFGSQVFGAVGAAVFAIIVSCSCFGAINATTITTSRLFQAAGQEGFLPSIFGQIGLGQATRLQKRLHIGHTPIYALLLNAGLSTAYILVGDFGSLIIFQGLVGYLFYFATVLGLIVLRIREPNLERPYQTWITTPIIFCCVALFLISRSLFSRPIQSVLVLAFQLAGLVVFFGKMQWSKSSKRRSIRWRFWKR